MKLTANMKKKNYKFLYQFKAFHSNWSDINFYFNVLGSYNFKSCLDISDLFKKVLPHIECIKYKKIIIKFNFQYYWYR